MAILGFLSEELRERVSPLKDFWRLDEHDIPATPGAYVLVAAAPLRFPYPIDLSPVFYIGQSRSLVRRLREHLKFSEQALENRKLEVAAQTRYWPRYEYGATFGGRYCYVQTWQGMTPRALEEMLMAFFVRRYCSFPVANSAGAWNRVAKVLQA